MEISLPLSCLIKVSPRVTHPIWQRHASIWPGTRAHWISCPCSVPEHYWTEPESESSDPETGMKRELLTILMALVAITAFADAAALAFALELHLLAYIHRASGDIQVPIETFEQCGVTHLLRGCLFGLWIRRLSIFL